MSLALASLLVVAVGVGGGFGYRTLQELEGEVGELRSSVTALQGELAVAEEHAADARSRAEKAEERAGQAEDLSRRMAGRARESEERAQAAEERADTAEEQAHSARGEAAAARSEAAQASEARQRAEEQKEEAILEAVRAEQEASANRQQLEEVRRQRERDLDRIERSLGRIAETRRTALGMVMNLGDSIEFDFDEAELRPENREVLSRIAGVLLTVENFSIQVYGHTDDVGNVEYNRELSERRAEAVRRYLVESGVDEDLIQSKGFGKSAPLVEGTDEEARQRNRRVEIAVVHTEGGLPEDFVVEEPEGGGAGVADPE